MLSSPRSPDSTMRIFSSAENWRRVARRISLMTCSAGSFTGSDCCPIFAPLLATMGHQPSLPQPASSVSQALTPDTHTQVREAVNLQHRGVDDVALKIGADSVGIRLDGQHLAEFLDAERLDAALHIPAQRQDLVKSHGVAGAHGAVD